MGYLYLFNQPAIPLVLAVCMHMFVYLLLGGQAHKEQKISNFGAGKTESKMKRSRKRLHASKY